jgi:hypothetical protein
VGAVLGPWPYPRAWRPVRAHGSPPERAWGPSYARAVVRTPNCGSALAFFRPRWLKIQTLKLGLERRAGAALRFPSSWSCAVLAQQLPGLALGPQSNLTSAVRRRWSRPRALTATSKLSDLGISSDNSRHESPSHTADFSQRKFSVRTPGQNFSAWLFSASPCGTGLTDRGVEKSCACCVRFRGRVRRLCCARFRRLFAARL